GYPVVDIYVDAVAPPAPQPRVSRVTAGSVSFTWDPVIDVGDGAGADYFASGMDHYASWLTLNGGSRRMQLASTSQPRTVTQARITRPRLESPVRLRRLQCQRIGISAMAPAPCSLGRRGTGSDTRSHHRSPICTRRTTRPDTRCARGCDTR